MQAPVFDPAYKEQRVRDLRARLAGAGFRITPQRLAVLDALVNGPGHLTAEAIYALIRPTCPSTSLATVYKTLDTLKALGELQELELGSGRHHYDALDPKSHPHVVCTRCGRIEDVRMPGLEDLLGKAATVSGYLLEAERLEFFGLCRTCRPSPDKP